MKKKRYATLDDLPPYTRKQIRELILVNRVLLEHWSVVNDVFEEEFAFDKAKISLGRIYENWKKARAFFEEDFDVKRYDQKRSGMRRKIFHP